MVKNLMKLLFNEEMVMTKEQKIIILLKDNRDLNYNLYEKLGNKKRMKMKDYNSENTKQLNISEIVKIIKKTKIELI